MHISKTFFQQFYNPPQSNTLGSLEFERYSCTSSIAVEYQYFLLHLFSWLSQKIEMVDSWLKKPNSTGCSINQTFNALKLTKHPVKGRVKLRWCHPTQLERRSDTQGILRLRTHRIARSTLALIPEATITNHREEVGMKPIKEKSSKLSLQKNLSTLKRLRYNYW